MIEYLRKYSYPTKNLGEIACYTPQLIFHHSSGSLEEIKLKKEFFPMFYDSYKKGIIKGNTIYFYLFRLHKQILKKTYNTNKREDEQIEELIRLLVLNKE